MKNIIDKLNKNQSFLNCYIFQAAGYYENENNQELADKIFNYNIDSKINNYYDLIKYATHFWIDECPQSLAEKCPHITFDETKIIFPQANEIKEKKKKNNDDDDIDSKDDEKGEGSCVFLRSKYCNKKRTLPWCMNEKRPACCCYCASCVKLPRNVRCLYDSFFEYCEKDIFNNRDTLEGICDS